MWLTLVAGVGRRLDIKVAFFSALAFALLTFSCGSGKTPVPTQTTHASGARTTGVPPPISIQISAASNQVVWGLVGDKLFRSVNAGQTWQQRPLPSRQPGFDKSEITFVDESHGWLFTPGGAATECQEQGGSVWRTSDAGATWEFLSPGTVGPVWEAPGIAGAQCKDGLSFVDESHGFLSAWDPNSAPVIYRTSDGGSTWTASAPLPDPPGQKTSGGGFALRPERVQRVGDVALVGTVGWQHTYIYRSTDGGATWAYAATVPNVTDSGRVSFLDATHWWVTVTTGGGIVTPDAGVTWQPAPAGLVGALAATPTVVFAGSQFGYAVIGAEIRRTTDGGQHWTDVQTPGVVPG